MGLAELPYASPSHQSGSAPHLAILPSPRLRNRSFSTLRNSAAARNFHSRLPSGRRTTDHSLIPTYMAAVTITVRKDASYKIEGDVALVDHEGNPIPIPTGKPFFS